MPGIEYMLTKCQACVLVLPVLFFWLILLFPVEMGGGCSKPCETGWVHAHLLTEPFLPNRPSWKEAECRLWREGFQLRAILSDKQVASWRLGNSFVILRRGSAGKEFLQQSLRCSSESGRGPEFLFLFPFLRRSWQGGAFGFRAPDEGNGWDDL